MPEDVLLSWEGYEHAHTERGRDWYVALAVATIAFALTAFLLANVFFALLIVVASITLVVITLHPPQLTTFTFVEKGLLVGSVLYPYKDMRGFAVHDGSPPMLLIDTPKVMTPDVVIPLESVDPYAVHTLLTERGVKERELQEPVGYRLFEMLGF